MGIGSILDEAIILLYVFFIWMSLAALKAFYKVLYACVKNIV